MFKFRLRAVLTNTAAKVVRLFRDTSGLGAVEFALIVPLMLAMFFGTIEISSGVAIDRKVSAIAQTVSDLVSRFNTTIATTDVTNVFTIADAMVTPYSTTPLSATVTSIYVNPATGNACVQWSSGDAARTKGTTVTVPSALIAKDSSNKIVANQYLIYSEIKYVYKPTVAWFLSTSGISLTDQTFTRPRLSNCVLLDGGTNTCTSPGPTLC